MVTTPPLTSPVGTLPGAVTVAPGGTAAYAIPIQVPPGIAGMQPALAIGYSSGGTNGLLGVGFGLDGLSTITRCRPTLKDEGRVAPIEWKDSDPLCLDGQRLVAVAGVSGKHGAEYRTRQDQNARITELGNIGSKSSWFRVEAADGRIYTYGRSDAAKVWARTSASGGASAAGTIYEWHVDRIEDRHRNAIQIGYAFAELDNGETRVEHRPTAIRYTERPGQPGLRGVALGYERRPDTWSGYMSGAHQRQSWRLANIQTHGPNGPVLSYRLGYRHGGMTGRSLLETVTAVAADGVALPETRFAWTDGDAAVTEMPRSNPGDRYSFSGTALRAQNTYYTADLARQWGDFDGDGDTDLVTLQDLPPSGAPDPVYQQGPWLFWPSQDAIVNSYHPVDTGLSGLVPWAMPSHEMPFPIGASVIDYNADGKTDVLVPRVHDYISSAHNTAGSLDVLVATGDGFERLSFDDDDPEQRRMLQVHALDLDGNALGDVMYCREDLAYQTALEQWNEDHPDLGFFPWPGSGTWFYALNRPGQGLDLTEAVSTGVRCAVDTAVVILDRDGDGAQDLLVSSGEPYRALAIDFAAETTTVVETGLPWDRTQRWCTPVWWASADATRPYWAAGVGLDKVADVNGDGLTDIVRFEHGADGAGDEAGIKACIGTVGLPEAWPGRIRAWINTGRGFVAGTTLLPTTNTGHLNSMFVQAAPVDWNSDGRDDLLLPHPDVAPLETGTWGVLVGEPDGSWPLRETGVDYYNGFYEDREHTLPTVDLNADGLHDVVTFDYVSNSYTMYLHQGVVPDLVSRVTNGLGEVTAVAYLPLSREDVYRDAPEGQPAAPLAYPVTRLPSTRPVVSQLLNDTGVDGTPRTTTFRYFDARVDLEGRGGLGFGERRVQERSVSERVDERIVERYDNATYDPLVRDYPYLGLVKQRLSQVVEFDPETTDLDAAGALVVYSQATRQHLVDGATYHVGPKTERTQTFEVALGGPCGGDYCTVDELADQPTVTASSASFELDAFGNVRVATEVTAERSATRTVAYLNDPATWRIGLPTSVVEVETRGGADSFRKQTHGYDGQGALVQTVIEPDDAQYTLTTTVVRHPTGTPWVIWTEDALGEPRWTSTLYDLEGVFPETQTNALGHVQTFAWNRGLGAPTRTEDANGLQQHVVYDGFGRVLQRFHEHDGELPAPPAFTSYLRVEAVPGAPTTRVRSWTPGGGDSTVELDRVGRAIATEVIGFEGEVFLASAAYDRRGRLARAYLPWKQGQPPATAYTETRYDSRDRPLVVTTPDGGATSYLYGGLEQWVTDAAGHTRYTESNDLGEVIRTSGGFIDGGDGQSADDMMCYFYRPFGRLHRTVPCRAVGDPAWTGPKAIVTERDRYGRLEALVDERTGTRQSRYNAFGELIRTTDALGQVARFSYDELGRLRQREDVQSGQVAEWSYDGNKKGLLDFSRSPTGHEVRYTYDGFLRPVRVEHDIAGETFSTGYRYDDHGRMDLVTYPSPFPVTAPFRVRREFDGHGNLRAVKNDVTDERYHRVDAVDAFGQATAETFGNDATTTSGYDPLTARLESLVVLSGGATLQDLAFQWDDVGNLVERADAVFGQREELRYDQKDRLIQSRVVKADFSATHTFAYDPWGNFTARSDVGTYAYTGQRLDAVGGASFWYDLNGDLIARQQDGQATSLEYTPFGKPEAIHVLPDATIRLEYDADESRVRRISELDHSETVYVGGVYERQIVGNAVEHKYHVSGAAGLVAHVTREFTAPDLWTTETDYVHLDHLGSPTVVSDESGGVVSRHAHDAWGRGLDPTNWLALLPAQVSSRVNVGFTGHEAQDDAGFTHMRGRHYDPTIGRFISADPIIQAPFDPRSLNRYSYVWNNPLTNTDPSGYHTETRPLKPATGSGPREFVSSPVQTVTVTATAGKGAARAPSATAECAAPASDGRAAPGNLRDAQGNAWTGDARIPQSWRTQRFDAAAFGQGVADGRDRLGAAAAAGTMMLMLRGAAMQVPALGAGLSMYDQFVAAQTALDRAASGDEEGAMDALMAASPLPGPLGGGGRTLSFLDKADDARAIANARHLIPPTPGSFVVFAHNSTHAGLKGTTPSAIASGLVAQGVKAGDSVYLAICQAALGRSQSVAAQVAAALPTGVKVFASPLAVSLVRPQGGGPARLVGRTFAGPATIWNEVKQTMEQGSTFGDAVDPMWRQF